LLTMPKEDPSVNSTHLEPFSPRQTSNFQPNVGQSMPCNFPRHEPLLGTSIFTSTAYEARMTRHVRQVRPYDFILHPLSSVRLLAGQKSDNILRPRKRILKISLSIVVSSWMMFNKVERTGLVQREPFLCFTRTISVAFHIHTYRIDIT
jgi:hypothetical protein